MDLEEKLAHAKTTAGPAIATLAQLVKRWGSPPEIDLKKPPELVLVSSMDRAETWHRYGVLSGGETRYMLHETTYSNRSER